MVASDPRFRDAMRVVFDLAGIGANLRVVILGEDEMTSIPPHVPTYIMGRAHLQLGDSELARRLVPVRGVFSRDMGRELLSFIVRANIAAMAARAA